AGHVGPMAVSIGKTNALAGGWIVGIEHLVGAVQVIENLRRAGGGSSGVPQAAIEHGNRDAVTMEPLGSEFVRPNHLVRVFVDHIAAGGAAGRSGSGMDRCVNDQVNMR